MREEQKEVKKLIHSIGLLNNLTDNEVQEIIESQFRFTYDKMREISLTNLSKEEIDNLKTNFYYKYIGKLYTNSDIVERYKKKLEIVKKKSIEKNG